MRRQLALMLVMAMMVGGVGAAQGQGVAVPAAVAAGGAWDTRVHVPLLEGWRFHKGGVAGAAEAGFADGEWEAVTVPHTWNAQDGQDGGNNYYKGDCWYRRHVAVGDGPGVKGKTWYLRFEGVNRKAEVFVNGVSAGSHAGGQAAFTFNVTKLLKAGDNVVAVKVSNRVDQDMPPLQADFTFFGGMYRGVELVGVDPVHVSMTDFGGPGVYVTTPEVTDAAAKVHIRAIINNDGAQRTPIANIEILDNQGKRIVGKNMGFTIAAGASQELKEELTIPSPHRWNGRVDPYLYTVRINLGAGDPRFEGIRIGTVEDSITQPLGIRTIAVDPVKGFMLNGKPYPLYGVNRHQDRIDKGWAISEADQRQDMALIKEMGCTSIRLAHYQHSQYFYDLCDKEGMVVWAEVPVVDKLGNTNSTFTENAKQQYTELIRQNFNHPSIAFWSAGNEVDENGGNFNRNGPAVYPWFKEMAALGRKEDPSRLTASAWREKFFPPAETTDVFGLNEYLGWYTGGGPGNNSGWEGLENYIAQHSDPARGGSKGMWAITEYGAGASVYFHSEKPVRMDHTEEYQALLHENTWKVFAKHPEIWGAYVWNMFDFAVDNRAEGDHAGINDKGLVTYDRKVKKDAFYFYMAVWSKEPTLWIASKRFLVRGVEKIPVKAYTNAERAKLTVNGVALGEKAAANGTVLWEGVTLKAGKNDVVVTADGADGKLLEDHCAWTYTAGAPTEVYEGQDARMKQALQAGPPRGR